MDAIARRRLFGLGLAATVSLGSLAVRPAGPLHALVDNDGRLEGRVVGADGLPIADAAVTVTSAELADGDAALTTDGDGRFALGPVRPGFYDVVVERDGYRRGAFGALRVEGGQAARVEIVLEQRAPGDGSY